MRTMSGLNDSVFAEYVSVVSKRRGSGYHRSFAKEIAEILKELRLNPNAANVALKSHLGPALNWIRGLPLDSKTIHEYQRTDFSKGMAASISLISSHDYFFSGSPGVSYLWLENYLHQSWQILYQLEKTLPRPASASTWKGWLFYNMGPWAHLVEEDPIIDASQVQFVFDVLEKDGRVLIQFPTYDHVLFLEILKDNASKSYTLRVYNSDGDRRHHQSKNGIRPVYDLVFQVSQVKMGPGIDNLNGVELAKLFMRGQHRDIGYLYKWVSLKGKVEKRENPQFNRPQDANNCTIESIHAFLVNQMERQTYKQLRIICLALILLRAYQDHVVTKEAWRSPQQKNAELYFPEDLVTILGMLHQKIEKYNGTYNMAQNQPEIVWTLPLEMALWTANKIWG